MIELIKFMLFLGFIGTLIMLFLIGTTFSVLFIHSGCRHLWRKCRGIK